jgi:CRP-like cAMP-binding protein
MSNRLPPFARRRLAALRGVPQLAGLPERKLEALLPQVDEVWLTSGSRLAAADRPCNAFLIVVEGKLRACRSASSRTLQAGDSVGWDAMWQRGPNGESLVTESDVRLLVMGHGQFRAVKSVANP